MKVRDELARDGTILALACVKQDLLIRDPPIAREPESTRKRTQGHLWR